MWRSSTCPVTSPRSVVNGRRNSVRPDDRRADVADSPARRRPGDARERTRAARRPTVVPSQHQDAGRSQRQAHRDLALRRRFPHARPQHPAALRTERKRCHLPTDRRHAGAHYRSHRQLSRRFELLAAGPLGGAASRHEHSAQHGGAEYFLPRHRAGLDATVYCEKSRFGSAHGEKLRRGDPHRQNQSRSDQTSVRSNTARPKTKSNSKTPIKRCAKL